MICLLQLVKCSVAAESLCGDGLQEEPSDRQAANGGGVGSITTYDGQS